MNLEVNRLFEANEPLKCAGSALSDLIEESPYIANLKDAQSRKYIQDNLADVKCLGLESVGQIVGLTDLDCIFSKWSFGSSSFEHWRHLEAGTVKKLDDQVKNTQRPVVDQRPVFSSKGFVLVTHTKKLPILSQNKDKTVAILTYSEDLTLQRNLSELLELYKKYYPEQQAIQQLLVYLEMDGYFIDLPSMNEMQALFSFSQNLSTNCSERVSGKEDGAQEPECIQIHEDSEQGSMRAEQVSVARSAMEATSRETKRPTPHGARAVNLWTGSQESDCLDETSNVHLHSLQDKVEQDNWHEMLTRLCAVCLNAHTFGV